MKNNFTFTDLIGFVSFVPFFTPENFLNITTKIIVFLSMLVLFLIYKIIIIIVSNKRNIQNRDTEYKELKNKHTNLADLYSKRINVIEQYKNTLSTYIGLISALEQFLGTAMITKDHNKEIIKSLLELILIYKKIMEVKVNGEN